MIDERFLMHRLKSTSLAGVIGAIALGGWFAYNFYILDLRRWDLLAILVLMAIVKFSAMLYFRKMD